MPNPTVVDLKEARARRTASFRERLFAVAHSHSPPFDLTLHPRTGKPCLTEENEKYLREMFALFGVKLDPNHEDFDLVGNTWLELGAAAIAVESRNRFGEKTYRRRAVAWSQPYVAFIDALWAADSAAIRAAAEALDIVNGVTEQDESLQYRESHTADVPRTKSSEKQALD